MQLRFIVATHTKTADPLIWA